MTPVLLVIVVVTIAIGVMMARLGKVTADAVPAGAQRYPAARTPARDTHPARHAPAPKRAPEPALPAFDWDAPVLDASLKKGATPAASSTAVVSSLRNAQRAKIRGRYLAGRFPGVARAVTDLLQVDLVIKGARLYFEERKLDRAMELLDLAIRECPADESLPLARLEIAFLMRDPALFVGLASAFRAAHPASAHWAEVSRLGRAVAPEEAMFGSPAAQRDCDHYGPWPDMPNWIQAPWDLTAEVRATEFHQAMRRAS